MITNEKQYRSTKASIEKLKGAVAALEAPTDNFPEVFAKAQRSALRSQIDELAEEVRFYEDLRAGKISAFSAESLHDLPDILIQARIARGMSQKDLGDFLGVAEQQIQRYEFRPLPHGEPRPPDRSRRCPQRAHRRTRSTGRQSEAR